MNHVGMSAARSSGAPLPPVKRQEWESESALVYRSYVYIYIYMYIIYIYIYTPIHVYIYIYTYTHIEEEEEEAADDAPPAPEAAEPTRETTLGTFEHPQQWRRDHAEGAKFHRGGVQ